MFSSRNAKIIQLVASLLWSYVYLQETIPDINNDIFVRLAINPTSGNQPETFLTSKVTAHDMMVWDFNLFYYSY